MSTVRVTSSQLVEIIQGAREEAREAALEEAAVHLEKNFGATGFAYEIRALKERTS